MSADHPFSSNEGSGTAVGVPRGSGATGMVAGHRHKPAGRLKVDGSDSRGSETVAGPPQGLLNQHCAGE